MGRSLFGFQSDSFAARAAYDMMVFDEINQEDEEDEDEDEDD